MKWNDGRKYKDETEARVMNGASDPLHSEHP